MTDIKDILGIIDDRRNSGAPNFNDIFQPTGYLPDSTNTNRYYPPTFAFETQGLYSFPEGYIYFVPYVPFKDVTMEEIGIYHNSTDSNLFVKFGIYKSEDLASKDPSQPYELLVQTTVDHDGSAGSHMIASITPTLLLKDVEYFFAMTFDGGGNGFLSNRIENTSTPWNTRGAVSLNHLKETYKFHINCIKAAFTFANLPDDTTGLVLNGVSDGPLLYGGVAA